MVRDRETGVQMVSTEAAYEAAMRKKAKRLAIASTAILMAVALFVAGLNTLSVGVEDNGQHNEAAATSNDQALEADLANEAPNTDDETVVLETELIGYWSWGWYHFNRWETQAIADWTPWGGGASQWALEAVAGATKYSPTVLGSWGIMWSYKQQARNALSQGKCLKVVWWGASWMYSC